MVRYPSSSTPAVDGVWPATSGGGEDVRVLVGGDVPAGFIDDGAVAEVGVALAVTTMQSPRAEEVTGDGEQ
ncbi:hypothetical protein GUJ93_ZPchr0005g15625 [Zizania palustris]|uniref:Uncharacterized protein n=1 Tax=Zizania palustris TaxID=103762 RepID=A0A8J5VIB1_ZIZPA|nr:hypothetical protein GUJ93_ZPchr0005g15625 [Zizania palustris]